MNKDQRERQLIDAEGRIVRTSVSARKFIAVMECASADAMRRSKKRLTGQGWKVLKTSGLSFQVEVAL